MFTTKFHLILFGVVLGFSSLSQVSDATAEGKINSPSQSSDDIDIDQLAKAIKQRLESMKEVFGDDPSEVGRQIKQASKMLDEVRSLSDRAFQDDLPIQTKAPRVRPSMSATAKHDFQQQAIRLPDGLMNWPMPKPKPRGDFSEPVRAFDFTSFDFSALERSLEFPKLANPSLNK